ncbi:ROK family protein [Rhizobium sp. LjRoot254]|uniref:ROK family protein n=1 Tax=Rhizobium sp. LjRoot254 TaxID=3342297 RepID=UPI003ECEE3ED
MAIICFDIGGSFIKGAVARAADDISPLPPRPTPLDDFDAFVATLIGVIAATGIRPQRIALSITGVIDPETGVATVANIPCIHGRTLAADLEAVLGVDVLIANDADCFALAEAGLGAGRGHAIVLGAILGSGVGGGLVVDGRLVDENGGFAGEWGHGPALPSFAGDPPVAIPAYECACGQRRCVNTVGGARGMERLHFEIHRTELSSKEIVTRWLAGDVEAARTIEIYVDLIASPLALAVNITGASIVPVGGGLSNSAPLIAKIDETVRQRTLRRFSRRLVVPSQLTVEPGLAGAALLGLGTQA